MEKFEKITEKSSGYSNLDQMSVNEILNNINTEDHKVAHAVQKCIPNIVAFVKALVPKVKSGGRLFYIGAGTSGRLGVLDASECPPTFGVQHDLVIGIIAGGDTAIRKAVEHAEDDPNLAWEDLKSNDVSPLDTVVGIAASGTTPYVIGGVTKAQEIGCLTACITCNMDSPLSKSVAHPIECVVGPEFLTGSSRMKAGSAQKMILNMISTALMIHLGRVKGNKMVDMKLSNAKLKKRAVLMIVDELTCSEEKALALLNQYGSVRAVLYQDKST